MCPPDQLYEINTQAVALQVMQGETVLINFDTGFYFSINAAGTEIVKALQQRASLTTLAGAEVPDSLRSFLEELLAQGVARPVEAAPAADLPAPAQIDFARLGPPQLQTFSDLRDLLLLDPIHDVANEGWPNQPSQAVAG